MLKIYSKYNTVITVLFVLLSIQNISSNVNKNDLISKNHSLTKVIACVGDSLTEGAGNSLANSYPGLLQNHFNESRYKVTNFGLGGLCLSRKADKPFEKHKEYQNAISSKADYYVFQFGTNDARSDNWNETSFKTDYISIIETFQCLPSHPIVFICSPPPLYCTNKINKKTDCSFNTQPDVVNLRIPTIISEIASITGSILVDNFKNLGGIELNAPEAFF
mmetsp:Transcript_2324/g.2434  ORF Transcript_2324/g.2434 Transcript_2324/m.2434 type:complete len:220 (+) Transcript_2324:68-727(+)